MIRFRYFAYTVSPSPSMNISQQWALFTCCCGHAFATTMLQSMLQSRIFAACILRLDMQNPGEVFPATCRMWLIRLAALSWRNRPDFAFALLSTGSFAPIVKLSTRPHGLFALPAASHAWERTCHFNHCSYVIFASNTDEIRGVSIVKNFAVICHYHFRWTFRCDFVNTDTCVKIRQRIIVQLLLNGHMVFYTEI